jgi:hypothetical protein
VPGTMPADPFILSDAAAAVKRRAFDFLILFELDEKLGSTCPIGAGDQNFQR